MALRTQSRMRSSFVRAPRMLAAQRFCTFESISRYTGPHSSALPTGI